MLLCFNFTIRKIRTPSLYITEKNSLSTNIGNKCVIRKINLYFLGTMENGQIFPSKVCHIQHDHRFLFGRRKGNIRRSKEIRLQNLMKTELPG